MERSIILLLLFVLVQSCDRISIDPNSVEGKLATTLQGKCGNSNKCTIRIKDVTSFDWDKMCVFKYTTTSEDIQKVIGSPFPSYEEFKRRLVFIKNGSIVHSEQNPTDVEKPIDQELLFDIPDDSDYRCYDGEAVFGVSQKKTSNAKFYQLRLIKP